MSFSALYEYMHGEFQDVTRVMLNASGVDSVWIIDPNGVKIAGHTIELWDAETGGAQLIEGVDYSLVFLDTGKTTAEGIDIWAGYQVVNLAYQGIPLYLNARIIGGYTIYQDASLLTLPIGYIYTQLPGKLDPTGLGLVGLWTNISTQFAGNFFRVIGGQAGPFDGSVQGDAIRNIEGSLHGNNVFRADPAYTGAFYNDGWEASPAQGDDGNVQQNIAFKASLVVPTASENRPINQTIQIWERTA